MNDLHYFLTIKPYEYLKQDLNQYKSISFEIKYWDRIHFELEFSLDIQKHFRVDRINITIKDNATINKGYKQIIRSSSSNYSIEPIITQINMSEY